MALFEQLVQPPEYVVAQNHGDLQIGSSLQHGLRTSYRIHTSGIGDHLHVAIQKLARNPPDKRREVACVAHVRIGLFLLLQNGHGDLGQVVEREVIQGTLLDETDWGFQPITPKTLPVADPDHRTSRARCWARGRCNTTSSAIVSTVRVCRGSMM